MLNIDDMLEILSIPLLGVIPESPAVLQASNAGTPVILDKESDAGQAYDDAVARLLGEERPLRFITAEKKGLLARLFGK
jgi:septum site-determining protein MinD